MSKKKRKSADTTVIGVRVSTKELETLKAAAAADARPLSAWARLNLLRAAEPLFKDADELRAALEGR